MLLTNVEVVTPRTLREALEILDRKTAKIRVIAGGSDIIIQLKDRIINADELLDISKLAELRYIQKSDHVLHIGALTTYSDIVRSELTNRYAKVLVEASKTVGATQLQSTATIGGNLGNASPAGDSLPPLYALDAKVGLVSSESTREVSIVDFFQGYRKVDRKPNELIREVHFSAVEPPEDAVFMKLGLREANAISIVSVAIWVKRAGEINRFREARVALGAVAPTVVRSRSSEKIITRSSLGEEEMWEAGRAASRDASPISDIRGSADYRREMVAALVYQGLYRLTHPGVKLEWSA